MISHRDEMDRLKRRCSVMQARIKDEYLRISVCQRLDDEVREQTEDKLQRKTF